MNNIKHQLKPKLGVANMVYRAVCHDPNPVFQKHIQAEQVAAEQWHQQT